jgi:ABC-type transporter Mla MlaB component
MQIKREENQIILQDYLQVADLPLLTQCLKENSAKRQVWNCSELDIEEGAAMAGLVALIKNALSHGLALTLVSPPQLLMHNLYRIGFYPHPRLLAIDIRKEEAYS